MDDLYDEFGNFLGGDVAEDEDQEDQNAAAAADAYLDEDDDDEVNEQQLMQVDDEDPSNAVVLHEDKQYYPSLQQTYGADVQTMVQEEDTERLEQPIIEPVKERKFTIQETALPPVHFSREFMTSMLSFPEQIRNIALVGHLHHGKTALMDMLVLQTHDIRERESKKTGRAREEQLRYTDHNELERARGLSVKSTAMSLMLSSTKGKSHLINIIDTPGHVNFADEVAASLRLADGVVVVVDVIEGVQVGAEMAIKHAVLEDLPLVLVINKMDRLILELKLPPKDAYFKLKHVIEEVNTTIERTIPGRGESRRVSPEKGNVAFACTALEWIFTLPSFAKFYSASYGDMDSKEFARRLWGDIFYSPGSRKFTRKAHDGADRSFVAFVLEPIYKLFTHTISQDPDNLKDILGSLGISLKPSQLRESPQELLKMVCAQYFGGCEPLVDMVVEHIPSPVQGSHRMLEKYYTGPTDTDTAKAMLEVDIDGPLVVHVTKLYNTPDGNHFNALGRVMSGTAQPGQRVRVLGEGYTLQDEEDMAEATIEQTMISEARYNVVTSGVPAGSWVLMSGIDNPIVKTATVVDTAKNSKDEAYIFSPIRHFFESVFKVAVEPVNPSELPKMLDGLRRINKSYPLITTKVEESGEHVILGTGELYMDCVMHDLRRIYAAMEIKVSDPVTRFCETCVEQSGSKCDATTANKKNRIKMVAEPLDDGIAQDIEAGRVSIKDPARVVGEFFQKKYDWDLLAARNVWAFGPDEMGPNILQNDTLPSTVDAKQLRSVRESVKQGFSWATREGPLCEEPIRNVKFRITDVELAGEAIARGGGQIIPAARRVCYSSFLLGQPRLMEPVYNVSMLGPPDSVAALYTVMSRRRGHVMTEEPVAGTPLTRVGGLIPVIDSFGFETDLRIQTGGAATVNCVFERWQVVPGDPLESTVNVPKLTKAEGSDLARDFVSKTRRRKGLREELGVARYLEGELLERLRADGVLE